MAAEFVDELVDLMVLVDPDPNNPTKTNAPLFLVPKEHAASVGSWRVIADMKEGGQNEAIGSDPMILNHPRHILELLYAGGVSGVADLSKMFYQFSTHPDDRPYLGCVHPITGEMKEYAGLAMGASQSPPLAGRYGLAFIRKLKSKFAEFQGTPKLNCWWTGFQEVGTYDPNLGHGYVLLGPDGEPAVLVFVHIDDFLIHGCTASVVNRAMKLFLDTALELGLLCHPKKLVPPQSVVEYCGFLFDTRGIPELRIPLPKRERALAMVQYLRSSDMTREFSRLSLAVVAGTLESLSDATPSRLGHTYL